MESRQEKHINRKNIKKYSGILIHITSLPGSYGIGDFGAGAGKFIRFLELSGQKYWQILPLNITNGANGHSPYSALSAFAGNPLFIDLHKLLQEHLLLKKDFKGRKVKQSSFVHYMKAEELKYTLLRKAFHRFNEGNSPLKGQFHEFQKKTSLWLNDFAMYMALKEHYQGKPWTEWPEKYRNRDQEALLSFADDKSKEIDFIKFCQFLFEIQWKELKNTANDAGIKIFGDIPIYVSHDSADVWAHPDLFDINKDGSMRTIAGVPPDYFNEEGQNWGMPIYRWKFHKESRYRWWMDRIRKNLEWFDLLRLDHFRGFASYWEIPAGETTAIHGSWKKGPGDSFFKFLQAEYPDMPFVAEDLGMIDQPVYDLRDKYHLPGMRVLQFGFGDNPAENMHFPENYISNSVVYTGTHDNNTLRGWYHNEIDKESRSLIRSKTGNRIRIRKVLDELIKWVLNSNGQIAIIPFQDYLGRDEESRMNEPSTTEGNWNWKVHSKNVFNRFLARKIRIATRQSGRIH